MLSRTVVQVLVAVFIPSLLGLAAFGALGWGHSAGGIGVAAAIGLGLSIRRRLRRRPCWLLAATSVLCLVLGVACHLATSQAAVIENRSGQTAWLHVWPRGGGNEEIKIDGLATGRRIRFSFEAPFVARGITCHGVLRDGTHLRSDDSADAFSRGLHHFTRVQLLAPGICHYSPQ